MVTQAVPAAVPFLKQAIAFHYLKAKQELRTGHNLMSGRQLKLYLGWSANVVSILSVVLLLFCSGTVKAAEPSEPSCLQKAGQQQNAPTNGGSLNLDRTFQVGIIMELAAIPNTNKVVLVRSLYPDSPYTAELLDMDTGSKTPLLAQFPCAATPIATTPDGATFVIACGTRIIFWDTASARQSQEITSPVGTVWSLAFSPDGKTLAVGSWKGGIALLDPTQGSVRASLDVPKPEVWSDIIWSLTFTPDGNTLISAGQDTHVKLWDVATGQEKGVLKGHSKPVCRIRLSPDGKLLATAAMDHTVRLWNLSDGKLVKTLQSFGGVFPRIAFAGAENYLAIADGRHIELRETVRWSRKCISADMAKPIYLMDVFDSGKRLVTTDGRELKVWSVSAN